MLNFTYKTYTQEIPKNIECLLVADIGGTNSNFGFFRFVSGELELLFSVHAKSKEITDFAQLVVEVLAYAHATYQISAKRSCFAAAGVVSEHQDYCKPTNADFYVDTKKILAATTLERATIVNDFEVIGYGLAKINPKDLVQIAAGKQRAHANKVIIGAGTGLGKSILVWDAATGRHRPLASEGGHADFAPQSQLEFELTNFIRRLEGWECNVSWEDVLSGYGIQRIYKFFKHHNNKVAADAGLAKEGLHPDEIFNSRNLDEHAFNTFEFYAHFYARCSKNFALDALALGGVYIAGGIAAKNLQLFQLDCFMHEFINCGKQKELLKEVPVFVITDYNVSLYGAAEYMVLEGLCD